DGLVGDWIAAHDLAAVEERFLTVDVAGTAVRSVDEIRANPHVAARGALLPLTSASGRAFLAPAAVPRLSRTTARAPERAPRLGEHTAAVAALAAAQARGAGTAAAAPAGAGALAGLRVLDLSQWLAGPAAAALLGDFGADVIMVELPGE